mgnify:CR=1 FL=1
MAGGQERILKRRIASVQSTKKITRAMELIAASRIVKAQGAVQAAIPYSEQITKVVADLAASGGASESPLLNPRDEVRTSAHIVITADRGLCGAYNSSVIRAAEGSMREDVEAGVDHALVVVGRKAEGYFRYRNFDIDGAYTGFSDQPTYEDARTIGRMVAEKYVSGEYDKVELVYTRFVSAGSQEGVRRPLLPLEHEVVEGGDGRPEDEDGEGGHRGAGRTRRTRRLVGGRHPCLEEGRLDPAEVVVDRDHDAHRCHRKQRAGSGLVRGDEDEELAKGIEELKKFIELRTLSNIKDVNALA